MMATQLSELMEVPSATITGLNFSIATHEEKEKLAVLEIKNASAVTDRSLGLPNPDSQCHTCGAKDLKSCEGHFGVINFPYTILHPYLLAETVQILNQICPGCKSIRKDKRKDKLVGQKTRLKAVEQPLPEPLCKYCNDTKAGWYPKMKFKPSSKDIFGKTAVIAEIYEPKTKSKKKNLRKVAADYWQIIPIDEQEKPTVEPHIRVLTHAQVRHLLDGVDPDFIEKFVLKRNSIFINNFSVTPNCHRLTEVTRAFSNDQRVIFDERTRAYKRVADFRGLANELSFRVSHCLKTSKLTPDAAVTEALTAFVQQNRNSETNTKSSGLRWIKDVVLGKRNDNCLRMVVVGDPNIKLDEIGIPCHIAERLNISECLTRWNRERLSVFCEVNLLLKGEVHVRRAGNLVRVRDTKQLRIGDTIYRPLADGDSILINRPPSIHQHSLIAFSVKILPGRSVLAINPLCCPPFRADFDGDCLHGYVPQSVDTRVELSELVALDKQLSNLQSGRNLLSLSQDSLVAAHLVLEDGVFVNVKDVQQLQMFCPHKLSSAAVVKAPSIDGCAWTGRQLISMLLPEDFNHDFPSNRVCVRGGEIMSSEGSFWLRDTDGNIFQSLIKHCPNHVLDFFFQAQELLCEWLTKRGLSVSLSDMYMSPDLYSHENMMDEIFNGLQDATYTSNLEHLMVDSCRDFLVGNDEENQCLETFDAKHFCYEKQRSAAVSQASLDAFKQVFRDIQTLVYKYASKDNALLAMYKAGSKGNLLRLVQHGMCLGLQHSLVPLSFRLPHQLSCASWNKQKDDDVAERAKCYIPSAVVRSSFLSGLNPIECFSHSVTNRDSSFSDNADLPGTMTRRLMFFMRDLHGAYDGTVRNAYGNQIVQFSYNTNVSGPPSIAIDGAKGIGGQPVGSLAACAISEAAYSALDQPVSLLQKSPLLNLKNVMECGIKKKLSRQTMTLFLSKRLGRLMHGFEYGALEVQNHLERLLFSDIVSFDRLIYSPQSDSSSGSRISPWVCHFHVNKEIVKEKNMKVHSIIDAMYKRCKSKDKFVDVQISSKDCSVADTVKEKEETFCITVSIVENPKSLCKLETIQDIMIPFLLGTVVKGFMEITKVEILWKDNPKMTKSDVHSEGELYLRVSMSGFSDKTRPWNKLVNDCLPIMDMIDWRRSHPDNVHDLCLAYGIDAGLEVFLTKLEAAMSDAGKSVLPQHLLLVASCLSVTGEFAGLNVNGLKQQRESASISSPFVQACFSNPGNCFIKAAKAGTSDNLSGSLDALAWGKVPSIGTGQFDILYSGKGAELAKPVDVYNILATQSSFDKRYVYEEPYATHRFKSKICDAQLWDKAGGYAAKGDFMGSISKSNLQAKLIEMLTSSDIMRLSGKVRHILNKYPVEHELDEYDKSILMSALFFHPRRDEKIGVGAGEIKVINHPEHKSTRCFALVRTDGTTEDFSYIKCIAGALQVVAPEKAKGYMERRLKKHTPQWTETVVGDEPQWTETAVRDEPQWTETAVGDEHGGFSFSQRAKGIADEVVANVDSMECFD